MKNIILTSLLTAVSILVLPNKLMAQETKEKDTVAKDTVADWASLTTPPTYPGGMTAFYTFLERNIKYPKQAIDSLTQGKVYVSFVIEKDGIIGNFRLEKGLRHGLDEEAVRVLKLSEKWNPGLIDGKPVRSRYSTAIRFSLN